MKTNFMPIAEDKQGGGKESMGAVFMGIMQPRLQNLCTKLTKNATPYATQRQKWATA